MSKDTNERDVWKKQQREVREMMYEEQTERLNDGGVRPLRGPGWASTAMDAGIDRGRRPKEINSWGVGGVADLSTHRLWCPFLLLSFRARKRDYSGPVFSCGGRRRGRKRDQTLCPQPPPPPKIASPRSNLWGGERACWSSAQYFLYFMYFIALYVCLFLCVCVCVCVLVLKDAVEFYV